MITVKTEEEIEIMREGGKKLAKVMKALTKMVKPGITTQELNRAAEALVSLSSEALAKEDKIVCSFLGYDGYPACLCTSVNEEIVHAVPSARVLEEGDVLSLDLGIFYKGYHTDMAVTVPVGKVSPEVKKLVQVTKKALEIGIKSVKPGNTFNDISWAIQQYIEEQGFNAVRDLCGHGIGKKLHEDPEILNYIDKRAENAVIQEGMAFCLEPMVAVGSGEIKKSKDGHAYETADSSLSAHFEHTMAVTKNGAKILTVI